MPLSNGIIIFLNMRIINVLAVCCFCLYSCGSKSTTDKTTDRIFETDIKVRLAAHKAYVDSSRMTKALVAKIYAKIPDVKQPIEVVDLKWPEAIDEVYNIWFNHSDEIVCVGTYPFSPTGDWDMGFTHYFDQKGDVYAFERNTSFYNSLCTDGLAIEQIVTYYDQHTLIDSVYHFTDVKGNRLNQDSCEFPYNYPYKIAKNSTEVLYTLGLPL
ncbi:MAG: hypothetical protein ACI9JN_002168 [Bacteroidia bacterium]